MGNVIQGGARLAVQAHTGPRDCTAMRKSVRFELGSAAVTIQLSGATTDASRLPFGTLAKIERQISVSGFSALRRVKRPG